MTSPTRTTSLFTPLTLRTDMSRGDATTHWAGTHADKVKKLPNLVEYNQRLFSETDHGFWPSTPTVGTVIPSDWRMDGCAELRFSGLLGLVGTALHSDEVLHDEQNVFGRVIGHVTSPGGGRWWSHGHDRTVGQHVALLLRRRSGAKGSEFRGFVRERLPGALLAAGARDVRAYPFLPVGKLANNSPGVGHDSPTQHRYHAGLIFGVDDRQQLSDLLDSDPVRYVVDRQHTVLTAVHAYAIERTVPAVTYQGRR